MKHVLILFVFLYVSTTFGIREVGDGAGGVFSNGAYLTFSSAQVPVIPTPLAASEVPGMEYLVQQVQKMDLTPTTRQQFMSLIYPTTKRLYFQSDDSKLDSPQMQSLVEKYASLTNVPQKSVVIFALTDRFTSSTVLLPSFYKLQKDSERAALLLHEAAWLNGPSSYKDVVQTEMATQAYFEKGELDPQVYYHFYDMLKQFFDGPVQHARILAYACITHDSKARLLQSDGLSPGQIYLKDLLGPNYIHCVAHSRTGLQNCDADLSMSLITRSEQNPDFLLLRFLSEYYLQHLDGFKVLDNARQTLDRIPSPEQLYIDFNTPDIFFDWAYPVYRDYNGHNDKVGVFYPTP
jgi:hypothetical protein